MPFNILLLPLLGGFIFISRWNCTRWYAIRAEKERLIFYAAIAGFSWLVIAFFVQLFVAPWIPCVPDGPCLPEWWASHVPFEYSGISTATFLLAATMWIPLNETGIWNRKAQAMRVIKTQGTVLETFVARAMDNSKHVLLTLRGGKVYVGRIVRAFEPAQRDPTILVFPTLSGYRESGSQIVCWTTNYDSTYAEIGRDYDEDTRKRIMEEFRIVVPLTEITSMTLFSYEIHDKYFSPTKPTSSIR